jgi:pilus assembly protein CpaE
MFDYVVVDCARQLDETTLQVFDLADTLLVVMTADLLSLKNATLVLDMGRNLGYHRDKIQLVLNRANSISSVNIRDAEGILKQRIHYEIPNDFKAAGTALNQGTPFVLDKAESVLTKAILDLARAIDRGSPVSAPAREPASAGAGAQAAVKPG